MLFSLFFCSKFVSGRETDVVGAHLGADLSSVEGLGAGDSPVVVDLVLDRLLDVVALVPVGGDGDLRLLGEVVLDAGADGDGVALDALEGTVAEDGLERVLGALLDSDVAAGGHELADEVGAEEELLVLVVSGLVDSLGPLLREGLGVPDAGEAEVDLVVHLNVDLGLDGSLFLLVVLHGGLNQRKHSHAIKSIAGWRVPRHLRGELYCSRSWLLTLKATLAPPRSGLDTSKEPVPFHSFLACFTSPAKPMCAFQPSSS